MAGFSGINFLFKVLGKTYQQRYYVNKEFWSGPDSPVFLFIGGEGTLSDTSIALGMYQLHHPGIG